MAGSISTTIATCPTDVSSWSYVTSSDYPDRLQQSFDLNGRDWAKFCASHQDQKIRYYLRPVALSSHQEQDVESLRRELLLKMSYIVTLRASAVGMKAAVKNAEWQVAELRTHGSSDSFPITPNVAATVGVFIAIGGYGIGTTVANDTLPYVLTLGGRWLSVLMYDAMEEIKNEKGLCGPSMVPDEHGDWKSLEGIILKQGIPLAITGAVGIEVGVKSVQHWSLANDQPLPSLPVIKINPSAHSAVPGDDINIMSGDLFALQGLKRRLESEEKAIGEQLKIADMQLSKLEKDLAQIVPQSDSLTRKAWVVAAALGGFAGGAWGFCKVMEMVRNLYTWSQFRNGSELIKYSEIIDGLVKLQARQWVELNPRLRPCRSQERIVWQPMKSPTKIPHTRPRLEALKRLTIEDIASRLDGWHEGTRPSQKTALLQALRTIEASVGNASQQFQDLLKELNALMQEHSKEAWAVLFLAAFILLAVSFPEVLPLFAFA